MEVSAHLTHLASQGWHRLAMALLMYCPMGQVSLQMVEFI